jgi:sn-glycerol 3-phosphate transport system substrate-binding protein
MKMRPILFISLIVCLSILAACSSDTSTSSEAEVENESTENNEKTTLEFWHALGGENGERIDSMVERFNNSQDQIEVVATYQGGYDETVTKLQQGIASDTGPDLAMIERAYVQMFADSDTLEDLTPYFEASDILSEEDFTDGLMGHSYFNDQMVSLPFNRSTPILHVNKTLLDEEGLDVPTTWEELEEAANTLAIEDGDGFERYGITMPYDTWYPIAMITQSGGAFFNEDNTSDGFIDNGVGNEVFEYLTDLQNTGGLYYPPAQDSGDIVTQMFLSEEVGIMYKSTGDIGSLEENVDFEYETAFLPQNDEFSTPTGGANISMLASSDNKEATWQFIEWAMTESEGALQFILDSGYLPFMDTMVESEEIQTLWEEEPNRKVAYEQLEYAVDTNNDVNWPEIMHEFFSAIEAIMYDSEDIDTTLETFQQETERILAQ